MDDFKAKNAFIKVYFWMSIFLKIEFFQQIVLIFFLTNVLIFEDWKTLGFQSEVILVLKHWYV